ncbi:DNA-binding response regulator [Labrys miyagiensis]|uniref:DNA-binding response regulator n=1 Tax=Labrys miyagiensis TaxID=346912 RepID=A0ABQ6CVW8_9HYPH|nr:response regulator transcription factor [Labrys miyagiensis]GLS24260.1 DNA-binding response regulator [Labrys miyagiensis]
MRILVVEDDPMIGPALLIALRQAALAADLVRNADDGEEALANHEYALVLLDIGLPGRDGLTLLSGIRARKQSVPVLIITARDGLDERVAGLDSGADDYIVKPFEMKELLARMRVAARRRPSNDLTATMAIGDLSLNLHNREATYRGETQQLSAKEFSVFEALMRRPGGILSRAQLEEQVYGWGEEVESNAVDVLIHYIRRKFGKDIIQNVRGLGWRIDKASP